MHIELIPNKLLLIIPLKIVALKVPNPSSFQYLINDET